MTTTSGSKPLELAEHLVAEWEDKLGSVNPRVRGYACVVFTNDVRDHLRDDIVMLINTLLTGYQHPT